MVKNLTFEGVHAFTEAQLLQMIYARRGRAFNPSALILDTLRIAEAYQDRGYRPRVSRRHPSRTGSTSRCTTWCRRDRCTASDRWTISRPGR